MDVFMGMIGLFGFSFPPKNWALCAGQIMPISQNTALFSLLGTTYGGDGVQTFALPDLRGRVPNGQGQGPGLSDYQMGQVAGTESVTLLQSQMPQHNHLLNVSGMGGTQNTPAGNVTAQVLSSEEQPLNAFGATANATANPQAIGLSGNSLPHDNLSPYLTMNYSIALNGIYPSRN
ncbi:phage tail protein [Fibrella aquatilis]|uniref:Phage tail protein n=1 Tax=Fibrella aquatilis TaxID=2817059 RepID=A0A939K053_9BACT|nr:tail fiber protein [Fibrella aquatilis]MBO0930880.1 phage tail protein [Fibrella aquatilis]